MGAPIFFAPLRTPLVDARTGLMAREWYLFFQALWMRSGGALNADADAAFITPTGIDRAPADTLGFDQLPQFQPLISVDVLTGEFADLRAQVEGLSKAVQDLKQGQVVL